MSTLSTNIVARREGKLQGQKMADQGLNNLLANAGKFCRTNILKE